jgi:hypothetical protein
MFFENRVGAVGVYRIHFLAHLKHQILYDFFLLVKEIVLEFHRPI